jgi:hypothetical protein
MRMTGASLTAGSGTRDEQSLRGCSSTAKNGIREELHAGWPPGARRYDSALRDVGICG